MFLLFAFLLACMVATVIAWPVIAHTALPIKTKRRIASIAMVLIVMPGMILYILLGIPQLAVF